MSFVSPEYLLRKLQVVTLSSLTFITCMFLYIELCHCYSLTNNINISMDKLFFSAAILFLLTSFSYPSVSEKCDGVLLEMLPCIDYAKVGSNLTAPTENCCSGLTKIVEADPTCLCDAADMAKEFNINITRAEDLPKTCKTNYNGSCNAADSAPVPAPSVVQIAPSSAPIPALSPTLEPSPAPSPSESHSASGNISPVQSPSESVEGPSSSASLESLDFLLALTIASFTFLAV